MECFISTYGTCMHVYIYAAFFLAVIREGPGVAAAHAPQKKEIVVASECDMELAGPTAKEAKCVPGDRVFANKPDAFIWYKAVVMSTKEADNAAEGYICRGALTLRKPIQIEFDV